MKHPASLLCLAFAIALLSCGGGKPAPERESGQVVYSPELREEIPAHELEAVADSTAYVDISELKSYAYTWTDSEDIPPLVVIIDDFGNSGGALLKDFSALPAEVAFAVLPDLSHTVETGKLAAQTGHEVLIHVPMQALNASANPGENYIKPDSGEEEIARLLDDFYAQLPMAIGANNHMGSAVTADKEAMVAVLKHLSNKGLQFVDSVTTADSVIPGLARDMGLPSLRRDIFLDVPDNTDATLARKIDSLAKFKGRVEPIVIITHCHNRQKLEALQKFLAQVQGMGLRLISLSQARQLIAS